jgi:hypothetical protein
MRCRLIAFGIGLAIWGCVWSGGAPADDSDDTLRYYLSKADLCLSGTIASEPIAEITEAGAPHYACEIEVAEVLLGKVAQKRITVDIRRFEMVEADKLPFLKQGGKVILFLKARPESVPSWETADFWFGCQQHLPRLASALKRVAGEKQGERAAVERPAKASAVDLAGNWLLTMPLGAQHQAAIRAVGGKRFFLQKAARFSGVYELREDRLVMVKPLEAAEIGYEWELRGDDEIVLVAQRKNLESDYVGAVMTRQKEDGEEKPKDGGAKQPPKAVAVERPQEGPGEKPSLPKTSASPGGAAQDSPTEEEARAAQALARIKAGYRIRKEPAYRARVQYCLLLLGREAKTRLWLASDGVTMYVDVNGNGDLTEPGEAVPFKPEAFAAYFGSPLRGHDGDRDYPNLHIAVRQRDWEKNTGGYWAIRSDVGEYHMYAFAHKFAQKPGDAPVVHLGGPLRMGLYQLSSETLARGKETEVEAFVVCHYPGVEKAYVDVDRRSQSDVCPLAEVRLPAGTGSEPAMLRVPLAARC